MSARETRKPRLFRRIPYFAAHQYANAPATPPVTDASARVRSVAISAPRPRLDEPMLAAAFAALVFLLFRSRG